MNVMQGMGVSRNTITMLIISLTVFAYTIAQGELLGDPIPNLFIDQAEAFLHGRFDIITKQGGDLALFEDRSYVPFPPLPAILLLPYVALFGETNTRVTALALILTSGNVFVLDRIFRKLDVDRDSALWLGMAFFMGTGYWIMTAHPNVWALAHIVAVTFMLLALNESLGAGRGILTGVFLGCAVLSRQMSIYASVFICIALWMNKNHVSTRSRLLRVFGFGLALTILVSTYLAFNWVRFDNPLDTGYSYIEHAGHLKDRFERYGLFHPAYVPFNFTYMFLQGPHFMFDGGLIPRQMDPFGTSLLFASPFVLFALLAKWGRPWVYGAWSSISLALLSILFYYNNGWAQLNNQRFALDVLPLLILLVAKSVKHANGRLLRVSIVYSVALNSVSIFSLPANSDWVVDLIKGLVGAK
jgi:hypothetical protein